MPRQATTMMIREPATYRNKLRERIKAGKVVNQLQKCVMGQVEMTAAQVSAARILLNKVLPDALPPKETDHNGNEIKDVRHIPTWKLLQAIEGEFEEVSKVRPVDSGDDP